MQFGTDGIRGVANEAISVEAAVQLGRAATAALAGDTLLIARDTRVSGSMLESALAAGAASGGVDVECVGIMPTPALAYLCARRDVPGAMISASHNHFADNGIKFFAAGGLKLDDETQTGFEAVLNSPDLATGLPTGGDIGVVAASQGAIDSYLSHLHDSFATADLAGVTVVLDCANGAASAAARPAFERIGATVFVIHDEPDGTNINAECGSTHPDDLRGAVVAHGADMGFAFDGDADRMLAVDHTGELCDGDQLIAIAARDMAERGVLSNRTVVVTVMTNLGFRHAMADAGIEVIDTNVGDRYVLEALDAGGHSLGGEQSGHIILRDLATTGDGILSALAIADICARRSATLAELAAAAMTRLPQVLENVRIPQPMPDVADRVGSTIADVEARLGSNGRVLVRPSGTEPVVRVMAEATEEAVAKDAVGELIAAIEAL